MHCGSRGRSTCGSMPGRKRASSRSDSRARSARSPWLAATAAAPPEKKLRMPAAPGCARVTSHVVWNVPCSRYSPLQFSRSQKRSSNCSCSLVLRPMPSSLIERILRAPKPACFKSTARSSGNGSGENHAVGDLLAFRGVAQDGQPIAAIRPARKPDQAAARRDLPVDAGGEPGHELIVAAADVEALIRFLIRRKAIRRASRRAD